MVAQIRPLAAEKGIDIGVDIGPDIRVQCDSKLIEQALFNLLDNAVKYTPEGGSVAVGIRAFDRAENAQHPSSPDAGETQGAR